MSVPWFVSAVGNVHGHMVKCQKRDYSLHRGLVHFRPSAVSLYKRHQKTTVGWPKLITKKITQLLVFVLTPKKKNAIHSSPASKNKLPFTSKQLSCWCLWVKNSCYKNVLNKTVGKLSEKVRKLDLTPQKTLSCLVDPQLTPRSSPEPHPSNFASLSQNAPLRAPSPNASTLRFAAPGDAKERCCLLVCWFCGFVCWFLIGFWLVCWLVLWFGDWFLVGLLVGLCSLRSNSW